MGRCPSVKEEKKSGPNLNGNRITNGFYFSKKRSPCIADICPLMVPDTI